MAGVKGHSGKVTSAAGKAAKVKAANARWAKERKPAKPPAEPKDYRGPMESIQQHDARLGRPVTWGDAIKRKQLLEQDLINARRKEELEDLRLTIAERRKRLVDRVELRNLADLLRDTWWREVQKIPSGILAELATASVEIRTAVKVAAETEIAKAANRVKDATK